MDVTESRNDPKFEFRVQRSPSNRFGSGYISTPVAAMRKYEEDFNVHDTSWPEADKKEGQLAPRVYLKVHNYGA